MDLADICRHVPALLDLLPPGSLPALSATSSTLRLLIRAYATSVTVTSAESRHEPESYAHVNLLTCGPHWQQLQRLHIEKCVLSDLAVDQLSGAKFPSLQKLALRQVSLRTGLVRKLSQTNWASLRHLDLSCNQLADKSFVAVVAGEAGAWPLLQHLNLHKTNLSSKGLQELCRGIATTSVPYWNECLHSVEHHASLTHSTDRLTSIGSFVDLLLKCCTLHTTSMRPHQCMLLCILFISSLCTL